MSYRYQCSETIMICTQFVSTCDRSSLYFHSHYYECIYTALNYHLSLPIHFQIISKSDFYYNNDNTQHSCITLHWRSRHILLKKNHNRLYSVTNLLYNYSSRNSKCFFLSFHLDLRLLSLIEGLLHHFIKFIIRHISFSF